MNRRAEAGFTLAEVVISAALSLMLFGGTIYGYLLSSKRAEWSAYSLAAHALALQRLEQARACKFDPLAYPPMDELQASNFPVIVQVLDVPISGTNYVYVTNTTMITSVSTIPPLKMIQVVASWPFASQGVYSNVVITYRAADQ